MWCRCVLILAVRGHGCLDIRYVVSIAITLFTTTNATSFTHLVARAHQRSQCEELMIKLVMLRPRWIIIKVIRWQSGCLARLSNKDVIEIRYPNTRRDNPTSYLSKYLKPSSHSICYGYNSWYDIKVIFLNQGKSSEAPFSYWDASGLLHFYSVLHAKTAIVFQIHEDHAE